MSPRLVSRAFVLPLVLALAASGCVINVGADQVVVREEKQFRAAAGAEIELETFDGSIAVQSWDRPEVHVEIQKRGPDQETVAALAVRASQEGNRIRVAAPPPKESRGVIGINVSSPSVSFVVRTPTEVKLSARTRDGSITAEGVTGTVNLHSGDGSIRATRISGALTARTDDGSITIAEANGPVALASGDGSVRVEGRIDDLQARTGDGSMVIEVAEGSAMRTDWDVSTGDGSIVFRVPRGFNAEIDAGSRDGSVRSDFDGLQATRDDRDRGTLRGRIGSGGHTVRLRSGDGSIAVLGR